MQFRALWVYSDDPRPRKACQEDLQMMSDCRDNETTADFQADDAKQALVVSRLQLFKPSLVPADLSEQAVFGELAVPAEHLDVGSRDLPAPLALRRLGGAPRLPAAAGARAEGGRSFRAPDLLHARLGALQARQRAVHFHEPVLLPTRLEPVTVDVRGERKVAQWRVLGPFLSEIVALVRLCRRVRLVVKVPEVPAALWIVLEPARAADVLIVDFVEARPRGADAGALTPKGAQVGVNTHAGAAAHQHSVCGRQPGSCLVVGLIGRLSAQGTGGLLLMGSSHPCSSRLAGSGARRQTQGVLNRQFALQGFVFGKAGS
mmetsp:Transcript_26386/g.75517  ORF Transcript_26386/g.75517 Transcript_26386/m.75517 type:complete len:317 (+) Transcript_26386:735-1685(+)